MNWLTDWIFDLFYVLQKSICYVIDFIKEIFYTLAGIKPVNVNGEEKDILNNFLLNDKVKTIFWAILLVGIILLFVFVFIAIIKSEFAYKDKKSNSQILGNSARSFITFLLVPFLLISAIAFSNVVVKSINDSMNYDVVSSGNTTIGGQILVTRGNNAYIGEEDERIEIEQKFINGELDYFNINVVKQYYKVRDIDFFIGIAGGLFIVVMFVMSSVTFIQRIFDIVFLFIISPICVSTIPLDEGNRFQLWKNMMIAKVLSAYGIILAMNLFFIIIPQVQQITFFDNSFKDGIIHLLFIIGGSYAVTKANVVVAQLVGDETGHHETEQLFANLKKGAIDTKAGVATLATGAGAILGGKAFMTGKNTTHSFGGGLSKTFGLNKNSVSKAVNSENKKLNAIKMPTRIASMPIGVIKDLVSGGVVGAGKNIVPRMRNIVKGDTILNHPQKKDKVD